MPAFYRGTVAGFLSADPVAVIGALNLQSRHAVSRLRLATAVSWERTVTVLKAARREVAARIPTARDWGVLLEYEVPRRDCRIDCVLLARRLIIVLEFKMAATGSPSAAKRQVEQYAIELRDFHHESRGRIIVPMAVLAAEGTSRQQPTLPLHDPVRPVVVTSDASLAAALLQVAEENQAEVGRGQTDRAAWDGSAYSPVPNIVEAAQRLFAHQSVREIAHAHAKACHLTRTTDVLVEVVRRAEREGRKVICFVTGVPGAGKTLAGLSALHSPNLLRDGRPAGAFLSGKGPLVKVLTEALAADHHRRTGESLAESRRRVRTFIQRVPSFLKGYRPAGPLPPERAVVFDEAQRAWAPRKSARSCFDASLLTIVACSVLPIRNQRPCGASWTGCRTGRSLSRWWAAAR